VSRRRHIPLDGGLAEAFDSLRADYTAARASRFRRRRTGLPSAGASADYHYRSEADYLKMLELSRDIDRNDCVVGQGVDRLCTNLIQEGLTLDVDTGDPGVDRELSGRWEEFWNRPVACDAAGEMTGGRLEYLALRHAIVDGDMVVLPLAEGPLQAIEGHRVRTPTGTRRNVVGGFLLDERTRKKLEVWITREEVDPSAAVNLVSDITPYQVWDRDELGEFRVVPHVYLPKRLSQTRGITAFAPIMDMIGIHDDVQFALLVKQQIAACFAILREPPAGSMFGPPTPLGPTQTQTVGSGSGATTRTLEGVAPGMEITAGPGEKLTGFSPQIPGPSARDHALMVLTFIAINLNLPLQVLLLDPSQTNFSSWRGAVDQARMSWRLIQRVIATQLDDPIYELKVRQWIADDAALRAAARRLGPRILRHWFHGPRWPYIEPLTDAQADVLRRGAVLTSPRRLAAERGDDWQEIWTETIADNAAAIRAAKAEAARINADVADGQPVHWRELLSLPMPQGLTVAVGQQPGPQARQPAEPTPAPAGQEQTP